MAHCKEYIVTFDDGDTLETPIDKDRFPSRVSTKNLDYSRVAGTKSSLELLVLNRFGNIVIDEERSSCPATCRNLKRFRGGLAC